MAGETRENHSVTVRLEETDVALPDGIKWNATSLELPDDLSVEDWQRVGHFLRYLENAVQFWIGDWINYGEHRYGEKYTQALEATDLAEKTLRNYSYVARNIAPERRPDLEETNLTFSHVAAVASLTPDRQTEMLKVAQEEQLTVREFRAVITGRTNEPTKCPTCGAAAMYEGGYYFHLVPPDTIVINQNGQNHE